MLALLSCTGRCIWRAVSLFLFPFTQCMHCIPLPHAATTCGACCRRWERLAALLRLGEKRILRATMGGVRRRLAPIRGIPTKAGTLQASTLWPWGMPAGLWLRCIRCKELGPVPATDCLMIAPGALCRTPTRICWRFLTRLRPSRLHPPSCWRAWGAGGVARTTPSGRRRRSDEGGGRQQLQLRKGGLLSAR